MTESATLDKPKEFFDEDLSVILDVLGGNRNAYTEIVRKYEARVRGYCLSMLSDPTQAEDAAQEIFIKAYQGLDHYHAKSSFSTWIYRITANHCLDLLRKRSRRRTESWEDLLEKEGERFEALFASSPEVRDSSDRAELVAKMLSYLPEKSRTLLVLREMQGLSYRELAETLKCSLDSVKSRLKRARKEIEINVRHLFRSENV